MEFVCEAELWGTRGTDVDNEERCGAGKDGLAGAGGFCVDRLYGVEGVVAAKPVFVRAREAEPNEELACFGVDGNDCVGCGGG